MADRHVGGLRARGSNGGSLRNRPCLVLYVISGDRYYCFLAAIRTGVIFGCGVGCSVWIVLPCILLRGPGLLNGHRFPPLPGSASLLRV